MEVNSWPPHPNLARGMMHSGAREAPVRKPLPPLELLAPILAYDPTSGIIKWRRSLTRRVQAGAVAGTITGAGYICIAIEGEKYQAHRIAWKLVNGADPEGDIDHINGDRRDNRQVNLRLATPAQNSANTAKQRNNITGYKGVGSLPQSPNRWQAQIRVRGKTKYLGIYASPELAHEAYMKAAREAHGDYATDGNRRKPESRQNI